MLRALPSCSHFMTTAKPHAGNLRGAYIFPIVKTFPIDVSAHARIKGINVSATYDGRAYIFPVVKNVPIDVSAHARI